MKNQTIKVLINEVECYKGNAWRINQYATNNAVQHQILVNYDDTILSLGRRNKVADSDRVERIVFETTTTPEFLEKFKTCQNLASTMMSEYCNSEEEYNKANAHNEPIKNKIHALLAEMHAITSLELDVKTFIKHIYFV